MDSQVTTEDARRALLQRQLDIMWRFATDFVIDQVDEELALWEPSTNVCTVHRGPDGWSADWPDEDNGPLPDATIAWLLWHIEWWWADTVERVAGRPGVSPSDHEWSGRYGRARCREADLGRRSRDGRPGCTRRLAHARTATAVVHRRMGERRADEEPRGDQPAQGAVRQPGLPETPRTGVVVVLRSVADVASSRQTRVVVVLGPNRGLRTTTTPVVRIARVSASPEFPPATPAIGVSTASAANHRSGTVSSPPRSDGRFGGRDRRPTAQDRRPQQGVPGRARRADAARGRIPAALGPEGPRAHRRGQRRRVLLPAPA